MNPGRFYKDHDDEPWDEDWESHFRKKIPKDYYNKFIDNIKNKDGVINSPGGQPALQGTPAVEELKGDVYTLNVICSLNLL